MAVDVPDAEPNRFECVSITRKYPACVGEYVEEIAPEISVNVTPSVENCHFQVCDADTAHVPAVAVRVPPIAAPPPTVGAVELTGIFKPGSREVPAVVEPLVSSAV